MHVFSSPMFKATIPEPPRLHLINEFKAYLSPRSHSSLFGKDVLYDHPHTPRLILQEQVRHVHLEDPGKPWLPGLPSHKRTSDHHLIYCQGAIHEDHYCLLALLSPQAHEQAKSFDRMSKLGVLAERFRKSY